nr:hypothetical protein L204_02704 [Cryptococcus depauperatus CBS 7855]
MLTINLGGLKRAAIIIPVAWTGAWIGYYAYTDTLRRSHIRERNKALAKELEQLLNEGPDYTQPATEVEKEALKKRHALGIPADRPIPDLPIERPDFNLLYPTSEESQAGSTNREDDSGGSNVDITDKFTFTWLGQSTSYVTLDKLAILTDPALQHRTIPSILAPERLRPPPCSLNDLKRVDVVLLICGTSHYDHLDPEAIKELGDSCEWIAPVGVGAFLRQHGATRVTELDWWQETKHMLSLPNQPPKTFTITAIPNMHWSARSPLDTNATLWSAFHVKSDSETPRSFIHLGDTGYSPTLYHAVGRVLGSIDLAAIPIGSYEPRWHMHLQHTDPEGAVRMALQMHVKKSIGVHWGTWLMSDEAYNKPPLDLDLARKKLDVKEEQFSVVPVGKTIVLDNSINI